MPESEQNQMSVVVRIGIPVPTSADLEYNRKSWPEYAAAVRAAGAEPVAIPLEMESAEVIRLARSCAGFLLPGSPADVNAAGYAQVREVATALPDAAREQCDRVLIQEAASEGKPVFGICFGLQSVNVMLGGTLVQDLQPVPVNHAAGASVAVAHSVLVEGESLLAGLLSAEEAPSDGGARRLAVNSSHHQAVGMVGNGLAITARSTQDGVIEALEGRVGEAAFVGVQWHPERSVAGSAASRALFTWLVAEATDFLERSANGTHAGII